MPLLTQLTAIWVSSFNGLACYLTDVEGAIDIYQPFRIVQASDERASPGHSCSVDNGSDLLTLSFSTRHAGMLT